MNPHGSQGGAVWNEGNLWGEGGGHIAREKLAAAAVATAVAAVAALAAAVAAAAASRV
jgi:hypothetical protein